MEPLATLDELIARCDWTFDSDETRAAPGYLEEASDLARSYGRMTWTDTTAPRLVKSMVISATRRYMRNPEGYTQSRAGDEHLAFADLGHDAATIYFTPAEQKLLRGMAGTNSSIRSAGVQAWGPHTRNPEAGRYPVPVPVSGWPGEQPFPMEAEPWPEVLDPNRFIPTNPFEPDIDPANPYEPVWNGE